MKKIEASLLGIFMILAAQVATAQAKTEKIPVSGNCGMCKKTIEKAAQSAGAAEASWDIASKLLSVKYDDKKTNGEKIQQAVADAGYDTKSIKGNDVAYEKLHACCQYERTKTYTTKQ
ncbi:heavy-metal-associated domain-containing protein [Niabella beijingensis]|uniref:heavy-metal-associated domain-containing protein n=1 Tax=Niabella beijingensis TaxID=2872700 RepID=UPI001CBB33E5|nr:cation transporter [Niabella beijingensis]